MRRTRSETETQSEVGETGRPIVVGHRGAPRDRVENTIASFEEAIRQGAEALECDVRVSRDGAALLFHDRSLERLAARTGTIEDMDAAEALSLRLRAPRRPEARVARLDALLDLADRRRTAVAIEVKSPQGPGEMPPRERRRRTAIAVLEAVRRHRRPERHRLISFDLDLLEEIAARRSPAPLGAIFDRPPSPAARRRAVALGSLLVLHHGLLEKPAVARWVARTRLPVWVYAIDSRRAAERTAAAARRFGCRVAAWISNCPGTLRARLGKTDAAPARARRVRARST